MQFTSVKERINCLISKTETHETFCKNCACETTWRTYMACGVYVCYSGVPSMNLVQEGPRTLAIRVRTHAQQWPLRLAKPRQKRNPPRYFRVNDVLACASLIWLCPPRPYKGPACTRLNIARGRFPKEFAINASSPHCASICFRLSTRGRRSRAVVVETNIRTPRAVCDFLRSCVFPRKWRRIDRAYRDPSGSWV